ncbi:MAG: 3-isopropylmalate dehydratase small subunit [Alphaproteobacteria bacterium]|nr:3-isopropylmalate dehydratase small subunit [Alphaproteobacteria bacterium]
MEPIVRFTSRTAVLPAENVDTDQIIPARFLTTTTRDGLGAAAFADWRYDENGEPKPDSPFNEDSRADHGILIAGGNFGCGSSREHAPWALLGFGFRAVISTKIADIFTGNALKNGLVPIEIDAATHRDLLAEPGLELTIDLETMRITTPNGGVDAPFRLEPFARRCLMDGVDPLGAILAEEDAIAAFEAAHG